MFVVVVVRDGAAETTPLALLWALLLLLLRLACFYWSGDAVCLLATSYALPHRWEPKTFPWAKQLEEASPVIQVRCGAWTAVVISF